ncbi:hypothetical protein ACF08O_25890 [Streptomyces paradoxus]|uniref:hypothetical protein n=1 Tax=Streptomyces paradoxus TaxID=66375 RepID=UPI0037004420
MSSEAVQHGRLQRQEGKERACSPSGPVPVRGQDASQAKVRRQYDHHGGKAHPLQSPAPTHRPLFMAWREHQIGHHLEHVVQVREQSADAGERLEAALRAFALITHDMGHHHDSGLTASLHSGPRVVQAQEQLHGSIEELLADGAR